MYLIQKFGFKTIATYLTIIQPIVTINIYYVIYKFMIDLFSNEYKGAVFI